MDGPERRERDTERPGPGIENSTRLPRKGTETQNQRPKKASKKENKKKDGETSQCQNARGLTSQRF